MPWKAGQYYCLWMAVWKEEYSYCWLLSMKAWHANLSITLSLYASGKHSGWWDTQSFHDLNFGVLTIIRDCPNISTSNMSGSFTAC
ncbi:hypothetical protein BDZ94DRAFT_440259 [Collybia nuda]|uniref:Uncharacterized protein n=1 Tax=Collybia nuda TaxID=64659 RepID=A0A9P5XUV8_9AGAR|nr:hypothetical protein BDZ94DRAFT_440259 [Collybia nuda]